jgi:hypothetical protein
LLSTVLQADANAGIGPLAPLWRSEWVVYAKKPFSGPEAVLAYLARYIHRVAISNSRLIAAGADGITIKYKDYRIEGPERYKIMTLDPHEFIRRFLLHVLPRGFHRIRHYGLLANGSRADNIAKTRALLAVLPAAEANNTGTAQNVELDGSRVLPQPCPCFGGRMNRHRGLRPRFHAPVSAARCSTSLDRYVVMPLSPFPNRNAGCDRCWAWSGHAGARPDVNLSDHQFPDPPSRWRHPGVRNAETKSNISRVIVRQRLKCIIEHNVAQSIRIPAAAAQNGLLTPREQTDRWFSLHGAMVFFCRWVRHCDRALAW